MPSNPFVPTFGANPYVLVDRDEPVADFNETFNSGGPAAPGLTVLITGERGMGKTVMLNEFERAASSHGWLTVSESGSPGVLQRLAQDHIPRLLAEHSTESPTKLTRLGGNVGPIGATAQWEDRFPSEATIRSQVNSLTDVLAKYQTGLAITIDEVHSTPFDELRKIGEIVQFARREARALAFAAAGLDSYLDGFLNHPGTTFLRRAERYTLRDATLSAVREALLNTITDAGRTIAEPALMRATAATDGYPFLIQLIGYEIWRQNPDTTDISDDDVTAGISASRRRLGERVHAPALAPLSDQDYAYVRAMAEDGNKPSRTADIAARMNVSRQYANTYRARLLKVGIIQGAGHGYVRFTIPYLDEYLRSSSS